MKNIRAFGIFLVVMMVAGAAFTSYAGYVVVVDQTGMVNQANVVGFEGGRSLLGLPGGRYFGIPPYDGAVEVQCTDGTSLTGGVVARGQSTYLTVSGEGTCAQNRLTGLYVARCNAFGVCLARRSPLTAREQQDHEGAS